MEGIGGHQHKFGRTQATRERAQPTSAQSESVERNPPVEPVERIQDSDIHKLCKPGAGSVSPEFCFTAARRFFPEGVCRTMPPALYPPLGTISSLHLSPRGLTPGCAHRRAWRPDGRRKPTIATKPPSPQKPTGSWLRTAPQPKGLTGAGAFGRPKAPFESIFNMV